MKKMNFDNQKTGDDEQLILLLKEAIVENPSMVFTESALNRILNEGKRNQIHKPLRAPLYMMLSIVVLLILPFVIPQVSDFSDFSFSSDGYELFNISNVLTSETIVWYGFTFLLLCFLSLMVNIFQHINLIFHSSTK